MSSAARKKGRGLAASFVITVAALPACQSQGSSAPTPRSGGGEPQGCLPPDCHMNPPPQPPPKPTPAASSSAPTPVAQ